MDTAALKRRRGYIFMALGSGAVLGMLLLLGYSVEDSAQFSRWYITIASISAAGVLAMAILLARRILRLVRDYRNHVPGSRLTARTATIFGLLVVVPLLVMYLFWLGYLNRGINSWFKEEVKEPLQQSVALAGNYMELLSGEYAQQTAQLAGKLGQVSDSGLAAALDAMRAADGAREFIVYGHDGNVLASSVDKGEAAPDLETPNEMLARIDAGQSYAHYEPIDHDDYLFVAAAPIPGADTERHRFLVARHLAARELAEMIKGAVTASENYSSLSESRQPLKYAFRFTLTLVLLLAMLSAIFLAIRFAHKLTRPVHDLIQGTRAVGKGDFGTRLALPSHDEMGILVQSFNDMTKRLRRASE
ncbi:MAG: HAMP domain-containing protein, partial [Pseudomonadota bacterium]